MKTTLAIGLLSLFCFSCSTADISATDASSQSSQLQATPAIEQDTRHKSTSVSNTASPNLTDQNTAKQTPTGSPNNSAAETPQYSGEVGTVAGDCALADFLFANDGQLVSLDISTNGTNNNHGEDWLSLCSEGVMSDSLDCTPVGINYVPATEVDVFWQAAGSRDRFTGFYTVRANQGMNQGFLSISLLGMP